MTDGGAGTYRAGPDPTCKVKMHYARSVSVAFVLFACCLARSGDETEAQKQKASEADDLLGVSGNR